jgi:hypothetical protein
MYIKKNNSNGLWGRKVPNEIRLKISNSLKGKHPSLKTREKMSLSHFGKENPSKRPEIRLKISLSKLGKKRKPFSAETRKNMSKSHEGLKNNWQGGKTSEGQLIRSSFLYEEWKKFCLKRDNYTDQKTGIRGEKLEVHHINNFADFPELRFKTNNGITFSKKTHDAFHKRYGKKNNNEKQLKEFLSTLYA